MDAIYATLLSNRHRLGSFPLWRWYHHLLCGTWMGVPVISLVGKTTVGRSGQSILSNLGLTELIAFTPDQYAKIAVDLALNRHLMETCCKDMRIRMLASALMNAKQFARDVEAAFRQMWKTWCSTSDLIS